MIQGGGQDIPAGLSSPPGGKINQWDILPPGGEDIQGGGGGGKISRDSLPPGGQAVQGGKINCYTGIYWKKINFNKIYNVVSAIVLKQIFRDRTDLFH